MWNELLLEAGLTEREVRSIMVLGSNPKMKASELAKELDTTRLDAYNSLSRLQEMGIVTAVEENQAPCSVEGGGVKHAAVVGAQLKGRGRLTNHVFGQRRRLFFCEACSG